MAEHTAQFEVKIMCQVLAVSASGYYAWKGRPESRQSAANRVLADQIRDIYVSSRRTYGVRRVHAALRAQNIRCGKQRVTRLMRSQGLRGKARGRRRPRTTVSDPNGSPAANVLNRDFRADKPNRKWLADITYIDTLEGFV